MLVLVATAPWSQWSAVALRRAALRTAGETAALALRLHDPYAAQRGVEVGGLPDRDFFRVPPPHASWFASGGSQSPGRTASVSGWRSGAEPTAPEFDFEDWDDPGLAELRARYGLDGVMAKSVPDYEALRSVSAWVGRRMQPGTNDPPLATHFDARAILARSAGGERFDCGTFAWTLVQVLCAVGINGRVVELEADDRAGHTVVEAWCDELGKWVVLDPFTGITFERQGVPLNALDLHRLWHRGRYAEVQLVQGANVAALPGGGKQELLGYYAHFAVRMRNNLRSARFPRWHPRSSRIMSSFEWDGEGAGRAFFRWRVRDEARVYFALKTMALRWRWVEPDTSGRPRLEVALASCTPNFDSFVFSRDRRSWAPVGTRTWIAPRDGRDTLWFAARNRGGRIGRQAWIAVTSEAAKSSKADRNGG